MRLSLHRVVVLATLAVSACAGKFLASAEDGGRAEPLDATAPSDAPSSEPARDSSASLEAGFDAAPDASPASPCKRANLFCDDFDDQDATVGAKWSSVQAAAGPFSLDEVTAVTRPRALRLDVTPGQGVRGSSLRRIVTISGDVKISLDARVDLPATGSFVAINPFIVEIAPASAGVDYQVIGLSHNPGRLQFESFRAFADGGATAGAERVTAANGAYHHFEISLRSASGTTTATLVIDGAPAATQALPSEAPTTITLAVGAPFTSGANLNATIWIDNVIVERL